MGVWIEFSELSSASQKSNSALLIVQDDRSLMVQWMDVNQLSQEENLHSKCLCINRLPLDLCDSEELTQLFSETYKPVFCQVSACLSVRLCVTSILYNKLSILIICWKRRHPNMTGNLASIITASRHFSFHTSYDHICKIMDLRGCGSLNMSVLWNQGLR